VARTEKSPLFVNKNWSFGGTQVATQSQYVDAFQRAQFWQQANPTGINPSYHVRLALTTLPKITVDVPAIYAAAGALPSHCGNGSYGGIEISWWDYLVQGGLLPSMAAKGVTLADFPVFLLGNVVMYYNTSTTCCILGYHGARGSGSTFQTYATSMYDNTGLFDGVDDVSVLSHELSEWIADPAGTNPTRAWGHTGQVGGCQANLETGDPLSGITRTKVVNNFTYHVQELAFYSWFYHQNPSQGVNGWFSNYGTFTRDADPC
jgi:hypothetical protein